MVRTLTEQAQHKRLMRETGRNLIVQEIMTAFVWESRAPSLTVYAADDREGDHCFKMMVMEYNL